MRPGDLAGYSALLSRHRAALPPTHYLMVITKRYLQTEPAAGEPGQELAGLSHQLQDKAGRLGYMSPQCQCAAGPVLSVIYPVPGPAGPGLQPAPGARHHRADPGADRDRPAAGRERGAGQAGLQHRPGWQHHTTTAGLACDAVLHRTALVAAMRENLALQSQASRWIQVVKVDGLL